MYLSYASSPGISMVIVMLYILRQHVITLCDMKNITIIGSGSCISIGVEVPSVLGI